MGKSIITSRIWWIFQISPSGVKSKLYDRESARVRVDQHTSSFVFSTYSRQLETNRIFKGDAPRDICLTCYSRLGSTRALSPHPAIGVGVCPDTGLYLSLLFLGF